MKKRLISSIIDGIFFLTGSIGLFIIFVIGLFFLVASGNPVVFSAWIIEYLYILGIAVYLVLLMEAYFYFVGLPSLCKQTLGMYFAKTEFSTTNVWSILLYNFIARFWKTLLFPIFWLTILLKKNDWGTILSGVTTTDVVIRKKNKYLFVTLGFYMLMILIVSFSSILVYTKGLSFMVNAFVDNEKLLKAFIIQEKWNDARYSLEQYQKYGGDESLVNYYDCQISTGELKWQQAIISCTAVQRQGLEILKQRSAQVFLAESLVANNQLEEGLKQYQELWDNYKYRGYEMIKYIKLLIDNGKEEQSIKMMDTLLVDNSNLTAEQRFVINRLLSDTAFKSKKYDLVITTLESLIVTVEKEEVNPDLLQFKIDTLLDDLQFLLGKTYYQKGNYLKARKLFELVKKHKTVNVDLAGSYLIDIELKLKKR